MGFSHISKVTKEEWRAESINRCVLNHDPECDLEVGVAHDDLILDLTIVSYQVWAESCLHWGGKCCIIIKGCCLMNKLSFQPYFCGQKDACLVLGSDWALQQAKENIEKW